MVKKKEQKSNKQKNIKNLKVENKNSKLKKFNYRPWLIGGITIVVLWLLLLAISSATGQAYFLKSSSLRTVKMTPTPAPVCSEFDGGKNYYFKGSTDSDYCRDSKVLVEYYCEKNLRKSLEYSCPQGCTNGICQVDPIKCTDTDYQSTEIFTQFTINTPMTSFYTPGMVFSNNHEYKDECASNGFSLFENSCDAQGRLARAQYTCESGVCKTKSITLDYAGVVDNVAFCSPICNNGEKISERDCTCFSGPGARPRLGEELATFQVEISGYCYDDLDDDNVRDDLVDNCPPSLCLARGWPIDIYCYNPAQGDKDGDGLGDSCDYTR